MSTAMTVLYLEIEPYATGHLDIGDGHHVYWEVCGNPCGKPALFCMVQGRRSHYGAQHELARQRARSYR